MPRIQESMGVLDRNPSGSGRILVQLIDAGKGSTANYPAESLQRVAESKVFGKGTHMYVDHPTISERSERPERSLTTLAASLAEDARWDPTHNALVAEAKLYSTYRDVITEMADDIGVSIIADAELDTHGNLVEITEAHSVDFVTKAGRGGRIVQVMESTRARVQEATNGDIRSYLNDAVSAEHGDRERPAYVIDHDDAYVYFDVLGVDYEERRVYRQSYTVNGVAVQLSGEPEEVKRETSYTPLAGDPDPAADTSALQESAQDTTDPHSMEVTVVEIEETEHTRLQESAGRADALEKENAELRRTVVESIVSAEFGEIEAPKGRARLVEAGVSAEELDLEAFRTEVREAAAEFAPAGPAVEGFGETRAAALQESATLSDDEYEKAILMEAGKDH